METSQAELTTGPHRRSVPGVPQDATAGLAIFGREEVTRWLTPAVLELDPRRGRHAREVRVVGGRGRRGRSSGGPLGG